MSKITPDELEDEIVKVLDAGSLAALPLFIRLMICLSMAMMWQTHLDIFGETEVCPRILFGRGRPNGTGEAPVLPILS